VESSSLKPRLVIELDDSSHQREHRKERDIFVEKVLAVAGIPIARVPVKHIYEAKEIGDLFKRAMQNTQNDIPKTK
jgi:very-short-patch-repair endonuclease